MYCNRGSQAVEETVLQYSLVGSRFVLQYKLYCEPGVGLCRDTARNRQQGALGSQGAGRARGPSRARRACTGRAGAGREGGAQTRGARWAGGSGARGKRQWRTGQEAAAREASGSGARGRGEAGSRHGCWAREAGGSGARGRLTAWALGVRPGVLVGQGCALGALGLFLARFDSVLFLSQIFGHCS